MKKMPKFVWMLAVLFTAGGVMASCAGAQVALSGERKAVLYKMTVAVETPEGVKTAFSVREARMHSERSILPEQGGMFYNLTKGEAVVVDLGPRGVLFALLGGQREAEYAIKAFTGEAPRGVIELDATWYPKFVRFRDINDPKTVENLLEMESDGKYPSTFTIKKDRFAEAFGAGVKLKSVTIEMTDEPVTWENRKYFPKFDGKPHLVNLYDFTQGDKK